MPILTLNDADYPAAFKPSIAEFLARNANTLFLSIASAWSYAGDNYFPQNRAQNDCGRRTESDSA